MTIEGSLTALDRGAARLADALGALQVTVFEDAPDWGRTMAVDELGDAVTELCSDAQRLAVSVHSIAEAPGVPVREDVRRVLDESQRTLHAIADGLEDRATPDNLLAELQRLSRRAGGEWRAWWTASVHGIAECRPALRSMRDALHACWQELADGGGVRIEHASVGRVSVTDTQHAEEPLRNLRSSPSAQGRARAGVASVGDDETRGGHR